MKTLETTGREKLPSPQPSLVPGQQPEAFVDAEVTARFLSMPRRRVIDLARNGKIPAYPLGDGPRKVWRFRLSEVAAAICATGVNCAWQSPASV